MDKLKNCADAKGFLQNLGIRIDEAVVRQVVKVLSNNSNKSLYSFYTTRQGKSAICGKGSVYKIKKLFAAGYLQPYVNYLLDLSTLNQSKTESTQEVEPDIPEGSRTAQLANEELPNNQKMQKPEKLAGEEDERGSPCDTSDEHAPADPQEKLSICLAPPDDVDVRVLKNWGIPAKKAGDILIRWFELHRKGNHQMCLAYRTLEDNLKNQKMPFRWAETYLNAELYAREFDLTDALRDLERSLKLRIWERPEYRKAYFKDTRDLMKPLNYHSL